jgi:Xaa-Pro aminopeptidase
MNWSKEAIIDHKKAAKLLNIIKDEVFCYLKNNPKTTEFETQEFVISRFKNYNLKTDRLRPIISFRQNTASVHYFAAIKSKKIQPESLVMVDIWARLNKKRAPFADITWMGYYGKNIPKDMQKVFDIVITARDKAINYLKINLRKGIIPTGREMDNVVRNYIADEGYGNYFLHGTGHSLGFIKDHGPGTNLNQKGKQKLSKLIGYTIEPGIYLKNKFGIRSEMDFLIDDNLKFVLTTPLQKKIIKI